MNHRENFPLRIALAMLPRSGWMVVGLLFASAYYAFCVDSLQPENVLLPLLLLVAAGALVRERLYQEQTVHPGETEAMLLLGLTEREVKRIYRLRFGILTVAPVLPALLLAALFGGISRKGLALGAAFLAIQLGLSLVAVEDLVPIGRTEQSPKTKKKGMRVMSGNVYMILAAAMMISALAVGRF